MAVKKLTYMSIALVMSSCSTPAIRDRIVEVDKPIAVQPIRPADVPAPPAPLPPRPKELSAAADVLLSKWCAAVAYMLKADPLLRVSAGMPQKALERYPECEGR
jgi:hypothetical protein